MLSLALSLSLVTTSRRDRLSILTRFFHLFSRRQKKETKRKRRRREEGTFAKPLHNNGNIKREQLSSACVFMRARDRKISPIREIQREFLCKKFCKGKKAAFFLISSLHSQKEAEAEKSR